MKVHTSLFLILFMSLFFGCKDKSTNVENSPKNVFTAKFTDNYLANENTGYIFISDMDGNVLVDSSWQGDAILNLKQKDGSDFPDNIIVTTVIVDKNRNDVRLTSNLNVAPSTWTWKGFPSLSYSRRIYFNYQNIPQHSYYWVAIHNFSYSGSDITYRTNIAVPFDFNDIYFYLNTLSKGRQYLWQTHNAAGDTVVVDFANLRQLTEHKITFPAWGRGYKAYIVGYPSKSDHYTRSYLLQYSKEMDSVATSVAAYYPRDVFPSYRASLYIYDDYRQIGSYNYYNYIKYGSSLPTEFVKMNADFEIINVSPLDFSIETSGSFDEIESYWYYDENGTSFRWVVHGPNNLNAYQLPLIPQNIQNKIIGLKRESFNLRQIFLLDPLGLSSYKEIISAVFKSGKYFYDIVNGNLYRSKGNPSGSRKIFTDDGKAPVLNNGIELEE